MESLRRVIGVASATALLFGLVAAMPAQAGSVTCGQVIRTSTTLESDLFCPNGDALVVQGHGISLDLNGHTVSGQLETRSVTQAGARGDNGVDGDPYTVRFAKGQHVGIRIRGTKNRVQGPGTVKEFAAGVVIVGGSGNTVTGLTVEDNLGPPGTNNFGDGIMIQRSSSNLVSLNTVRNNGPFDGIALLGETGSNVIRGNTITENTQPEVCPTFDLYRFSVSGGGIVFVCGPTHPTRAPYTLINQQNHGIKLEGLNGLASHDNFVAGNTITDNGNTGIFIPSTCPDFGPDAACEGEAHRDNRFSGNQVNRNGFGHPTGLLAARLFEGPGNGGSGITLMIGGPNPPIRQTVRDNTVNENARHGIVVLAHRPGNPVTMSTFVNNTALRNNVLEEGNATFNGMDGNAIVNPSEPCDANVWRNNNFGDSVDDIGGPVPPNNLTNHRCVGPMLPVPPPPAAALASHGTTDHDPAFLSGRQS